MNYLTTAKIELIIKFIDFFFSIHLKPHTHISTHFLSPTSVLFSFVVLPNILYIYFVYFCLIKIESL